MSGLQAFLESSRAPGISQREVLEHFGRTPFPLRMPCEIFDGHAADCFFECCLQACEKLVHASCSLFVVSTLPEHSY